MKMEENWNSRQFLGDDNHYNNTPKVKNSTGSFNRDNIGGLSSCELLSDSCVGDTDFQDGNFSVTGKESPWPTEEDCKLLEAICQCGADNWEDISKCLKNRKPEDCKKYYYNAFIENPKLLELGNLLKKSYSDFKDHCHSYCSWLVSDENNEHFSPNDCNSDSDEKTLFEPTCSMTYSSQNIGGESSQVINRKSEKNSISDSSVEVKFQPGSSSCSGTTSEDETKYIDYMKPGCSKHLNNKIQDNGDADTNDKMYLIHNVKRTKYSSADYNKNVLLNEITPHNYNEIDHRSVNESCKEEDSIFDTSNINMEEDNAFNELHVQVKEELDEHKCDKETDRNICSRVEKERLFSGDKVQKISVENNSGSGKFKNISKQSIIKEETSSYGSRNTSVTGFFSSSSALVKQEVSCSIEKYCAPTSSNISSCILNNMQNHRDSLVKECKDKIALTYSRRKGLKSIAASACNSSCTSDEDSFAGFDDCEIKLEMRSQDNFEPGSIDNLVKHSNFFKTFAGYNVARSEFDKEYDNRAEDVLACLRNDILLEAIDNDGEDDILVNLALAIVQGYNNRLAERARRKRIIHSYGLLNPGKALSTSRQFENALGRRDAKRILRLKQLLPSGELDSLLENIRRRAELRARFSQLVSYREQGLTILKTIELYEHLKKLRNESRRKLQSLPQIRFLDDGGPIIGGPLRRPAPPITIMHMPGYERLDEEEMNFCSVNRIVPNSYIQYKEVLTNECKKNNGLKLAQARLQLKIDVNKTRKLFDFLVARKVLWQLAS